MLPLLLPADIVGFQFPAPRPAPVQERQPAKREQAKPPDHHELALLGLLGLMPVPALPASLGPLYGGLACEG